MRICSLHFFVLLLLFPSFSFSSSTEENNIENENYEQKARSVLSQIVEEQIEKISQKSNTTKSVNENNLKGYVLSSHIRSFSDIPKSIDNEITQLREQTKTLIKRIASDIEISGGSSGSLTINDSGIVLYTPNQNIPKELNEKKGELLLAVLQNNVSIRSASLAFTILRDINNNLRSQADNAQTRQQLERILLTQAIFVYEMSEITIGLLKNLSLDGKDTIISLRKEAEEKIANRKKKIKRQIKKVNKLVKKGLLTKDQAENDIKTYEYIIKANDKSIETWNELVNHMENQEKYLQKLNEQIDLIEYKRESAKIQIETLRDMKQVVELRDSIGSLNDIVSVVSQLDLIILDENKIQSLLGYKNDHKQQIKIVPQVN